MKAFLLAGGRGDRLRPLTDHIPKCLVPIDGVPLLAIWLDLLQREGVTDVLLNVSQHVSLVERFLADRPGGGPSVVLLAEASPRGSAATVRDARHFVDGEADFGICYADNLTTVRLAPFRAQHDRHAAPVTMGLFRAADPTSCGIAEMDADGRIVSFEEKPRQPKGDLAFAGMILARPSLFERIPRRDGIVDFGLDVLPGLTGEMFGYVIPEYLADVGTPERLSRATAEWRTMRGHQ